MPKNQSENINPAQITTKGVVERSIVAEMRESYIDYAMSVIVSRALPDARDGLKPVHRRVLFTMHQMGLTHGAKFRKSAAIVGDTMGKYHPHGDTAIYDSLVRLAQPWSMRYPLVDGQGNFGSIDGDSAGAMRYTEARLTKMAEEMLGDIEKDTVDFRANYDATQQEPIVLPSAIPQLLLNGSLGIAVGMATNIPPHNLGELIDGILQLIDHPKFTTEQLSQFIKGPDFPTGGLIFNKQNIYQAYATGRGGVVNRGEAEIVEKKAGQFQIIISSIPYQVSKSEMIARMAELVHDKKLEGIKDIRDESDREGLQVAIDLSRDAHPQKVLNALYRHTDLERTFHFNMVALVDGIQPQLLGLKSMLEKFIGHRKVVVERRIKFELARAEERAHILEGLKKALDHIDQVIQTIKKSPDSKTAHVRLMEKFKLSDKQSAAILEMRLATLAGLERQKIEDELEEKLKLIKHLNSLLKDPAKMLEVIKTELALIKEKYGDERKTKVIAGEIKSFSPEDLVAERETFLILTQSGYVKRVGPDEYRAQRRGGRGVTTMEMKEEDLIEIISAANTTDDLLFFTTTGKVYQTKMYEIPEGKRSTKGKAIANFLNLAQDEKVTSALAIPKAKIKDELFFVMITENGIIKKVEGESFSDVRRSGIIAIKLDKKDALKWVTLAGSSDHIILTSAKGKAIRFKESDLRPTGRAAQGVRAMKLAGSDKLVGADVVAGSEKKAAILVVSANGFGKKTPVSDYRLQRRGGSGIKTIKITAKTGALKTARVVNSGTEELIIVSKKGQVIRTGISQIPTSGRSTQGARLMKMAEKDEIASITLL